MKTIEFKKNFANYVKGDIATFENDDKILEKAIENGYAVAYKKGKASSADAPDTKVDEDEDEEEDEDEDEEEGDDKKAPAPKAKNNAKK